MRVLVINAGSSSLRYGLYEPGQTVALIDGTVEQVADHRVALDKVAGALAASGVLAGGVAPDAIGHRVVHGGAGFSGAVIVDDAVFSAIEAAAILAPLHNPANLAGIAVCRERWPDVLQVAVFDTAFHQTLPPVAYRYALPRELYDRHGVRRYGFHGISHQYLAGEAARLLGRDRDDVNLITLHLGNGASATAVRNGCSVDTSMGLTPLEGLVMGTRCGDIDAAIPGYLVRQGVGSATQIDAMLNNDSGLKGLCGEQDLRDVRRLADGADPDATLAIDMLVYRLRKYIGAYFTVLDRVDALVFSGGIGENHSWLWRKTCEGLGALGLHVTDDLPDEPVLPIDVATRDSRVRVLVIATDEEREIVRQVVNAVAGT